MPRLYDRETDGWITGGGGTGDRGREPNSSDAMVPEVGTMQILLGEGVLDGLGPVGTASTDWLKYIYLDGTPIRNADNSWNFKGFSLALVAGTTTQAAVKGITGTESETAVGVQVLAATAVTRSITSNPSAVRVRISIPAMKVVDSATGNAFGNSVTVKIERQNPSYNGGAWEVVTLDRAGVIAGGPYSTKLTKSFRIDTPVAGTWQIRVTRVSADDADAYHLSQTWWEAYTEIVDARLRYPRSAVLSLRVNAKQFRSMPQASALARMNQIQVPANYNPVTRAYATSGLGTSGGVWDGTFKTAWSDSAPWRFFDLASNTTYGSGTFLNASGLDKWSLYSIAQWCDTLVPDGKGGTEPRMTGNFYIQGQENAIKMLGQMASVFNSVIYYMSGLVVPVCDLDATPVALFTNANVTDGKFAYEGTARQARHTSAIVKFINPDLGWNTDSAVYEANADAALISALGYDPVARYGFNVLDLQGFGCTSQGQALRLAKQSVLSELLAPEVVSFTSGLEGSTIKPGDVIQVSDQSRAGQTRFGGRLISATNTTNAALTLDGPVTLAAGTHTLRVQTATGMESKTVTTGAGTTSTLTVSGVFSSLPVVGAGWLLQSPSFSSRWRVLSVGKGEGLDHNIVALYHDPNKYALLGLSTGDVVNRPPYSLTSPPVAGLAISSTTRILNDRQVQTLSASWTLDAAAGYLARARRDYGPWVEMTITGASALLDNIQPGVWDVQVCGDWRAAGLSPWATGSATITASGVVPPWIQQALDATAALGSDGILSVGEKPPAVTSYTGLSGQVTALRAQATAIGATLPTANTLLTYLASLGPWPWNDTTPGHDTTIPVPTTWTSKWNEIYGEVSALTANIAAKLNTGVVTAAGTATWGSIAGSIAAQADLQTALSGKLGASAQAVDSAKLGGQLPAWYQQALGFTPINKAGDSGIGNLSMGALTASSVNITGAYTLNGYKFGSNIGTDNYLWAGSSHLYVVDQAGNTVLMYINGSSGAAAFASSVSMGALMATGGLFSNTVQFSNGYTEFADRGIPGTFNSRYLSRSGNSLMWRYDGTNDGVLYHSGNIAQNAAALMAVQASLYVPQWVGSLPALPHASYPVSIWNATTSRYDGGLVCIISTYAMYQNQGNVWVAVGSNYGLFGQLQVGQLAAGSVTAGAFASVLDMTQELISLPFTAGTNTAAPSGFRMKAGGFTGYCWNGAVDGSFAVTKTLTMEIGGATSLNGFYISDLALGRLVNAGVWSSSGRAPGNNYTWLCPPMVTVLDLLLVAAGAGGSSGTLSPTPVPGGGGGAGASVRMTLDVIPGNTYQIFIPDGGLGGATVGAVGAVGGDATFTNVTSSMVLLTVKGGKPSTGAVGSGGSGAPSLSGLSDGAAPGAPSAPAAGMKYAMRIPGSGGGNGWPGAGISGGAAEFVAGGTGSEGGGGGSTPFGQGGSGGGILAVGSPGNGYGSGGGGGDGSTGFRAGGKGAPGFALLRY